MSSIQGCHIQFRHQLQMANSDTACQAGIKAAMQAYGQTDDLLALYKDFAQAFAPYPVLRQFWEGVANYRQQQESREEAEFVEALDQWLEWTEHGNVEEMNQDNLILSAVGYFKNCENATEEQLSAARRYLAKEIGSEAVSKFNQRVA